jgi:hypothetical protein
MVTALGFLGISFDPTGVLVSLLGGIGNLFVQFFSYLLSEVNSFINWLVSLIPPLPVYNNAWPSISSAISFVLTGNGTSFFGLAPIVYAWNYYVALSLAIVMFFTALGAESALAAWKFIRWLLTHLPFGLGGGE